MFVAGAAAGFAAAFAISMANPLSKIPLSTPAPTFYPSMPIHDSPISIPLYVLEQCVPRTH